MVEVNVGATLGRLTVVAGPFRKVDSRGVPRLVYQCSCSCGAVKTISRDSLKSGRSNSCGCMAKEMTSARSKTHGMRGAPIYAVWNMMMQRCYLPSYRLFKDYGGRGISVDPKWHKFEGFYADMGDPPFKGASLERIDNEGNYSKENVTWADSVAQNRNKRNNSRYTFQGKSLLLQDWAKEVGINYRTLVSRIYLYGWSVDKALTTPTRTGSSITLEKEAA